jgi:hypothetical protein
MTPIINGIQIKNSFSSQQNELNSNYNKIFNIN